MRARGVRWTISRVSAFNAESIRAHQRLGARRTGWALFFLCGSLHFTLTSLGQLKCGRLEHGPYPVIDVRAPTNAGTADDATPAEEDALVPRAAAGDGARRLLR
jgi:hypothetical protein